MSWLVEHVEAMYLGCQYLVAHRCPRVREEAINIMAMHRVDMVGVNEETEVAFGVFSV